MADVYNTRVRCPGWGLLAPLSLVVLLPLPFSCASWPTSISSCNGVIPFCDLVWVALNLKMERKKDLCYGRFPTSSHPIPSPQGKSTSRRLLLSMRGHNEFNGCYPVIKMLAMSISHLRQVTCCSVLIPYQTLALARETFWKDKDLCGITRRGKFVNSRLWNKPAISCPTGWQFPPYLSPVTAIDLVVKGLEEK